MLPGPGAEGEGECHDDDDDDDDDGNYDGDGDGDDNDDVPGDGSGEESVDPVSGSWDVQGLEERRGYEARVQARNRWVMSCHKHRE